MKNEGGEIIPASIQTVEPKPDGYTLYQLKLDEDIQVGREYRIYNEFGRYVYCRYGHIVKTEYFTKRYVYDKGDLGCTYTKEKSTFKLWSPVAYRIQLQVIKNGITSAYEMKKDDDGIFTYEVHEDLKNAKYSFLVKNHGRWSEIRDPYTSFSTTNGRYSVIVDLKDIRLPKKYPLPEMKSYCDAILYEANIRDMTSQKGLKIAYPKTFKGFVEENPTTIRKEVGFSYLKSLGITHVQLMPVFDFGSVDEEHPDHFYNWGYDPVQFRVLEGSYSTNPENAICRVQEFIDMVEKLHSAGIRVNLDLVFNHVFTKQSFDLDRLIPDYYFLMNHDGELSNGSWCGNDIDIQVPMARQYFLTTVRRIIEWFDVDGFRFDLMGILDISFMNEVFE
ncbi:MAG: type I pullulanase, partial [Holdemanella sp.]|nr:type I pullulanase [Holdemanella sp.]